MLNIEIETIWRFHREDSPRTIVVMLGVLNEIRRTGKLTSAASHAPALATQATKMPATDPIRPYSTSDAQIATVAPLHRATTPLFRVE